MTVQANAAVAVPLSVLFAVTAAYSLWRVVASTSRVDRVSNALHLVMSVVMLAMPWSWYANITVIGQILFFSAAALWYVYLGLFRPHAHAGPSEVGLEHSPAVLWHHVVMMSAMVWMAEAMTSTTAMNDASGGMVGMSMPGMSMGTSSAERQMVGGTTWGLTVTWVLGIYFVVVSCTFLVRLYRFFARASRITGAALVAVLDGAVNLLMAVGMCLTLLVLMT